MPTYTTLGTTVDVLANDSTVTVGFNENIAIVGGMDTSNGSATPGDAVQVTTSGEAATLFGDGSELHEQTKLAYANGVNSVYAVPAPETTGTTESFSSTSSGTLSNRPFDPNVQPEHSITAQDTSEGTSADVNIVYEDPPSAPSDANTVNLNPVTKDFEADASSSYDITYDYGDYGSSVIETAADQSVRMVAVCSEADSDGSTLVSDLNNRAGNFDFKRGGIGAMPRIDAGNASSYTDSLNDQRIVAVAPSRGMVDGQEVRTIGAVLGAMCAQPLGQTSLYDPISGFDSLSTEYTASEAQDFQYVTSLTSTFDVAGAVTTSEDSGFGDVKDVEIIDTVAQSLQEVCGDFAGEANFQENRRLLGTTLRRSLRGFANQTPPLLATGTGGTPYDVEVTQGSSDDSVDVSVGIEVTPTMKQINLNVNVGQVVTFEGVA